jgi:predicted esterase
MQAHHIAVTKTARYYTLGTLDQNTTEIWIAIHGWAQLAEGFLNDLKPLDNGKRFIIAPEALNRFYIKVGQPDVGATWMTKEDREAEIKDYIQYLDALYDLLAISDHPAKIIVLGFSQGVATASRWVHNNTRRMDGIVFCAGEVGNELQNPESMASLKQSHKYFVCGTQDQFINETNIAKVKAMLSGFEFRYFEGKHVINTDSLLSLTF